MKVKIFLISYVNEKPVIVKFFIFKKFVEAVAFNNQAYIIDSTKPSVQNNTEFLYYINTENGNQLFFDKMKEITPSNHLVDMITNKKIIEKITKNISTDKGQLIAYGLIGAIMGALASAIIAIIYYTNQIAEMLMGTNATTPPAIII